MKRMHLHVNVPDLGPSIRFYESLFGAPPVVVKPDYAKWMLDDPRVNFAISVRDRAPGLNHVGIQAESVEELGAISGRLKAAGAQTFDQQGAHCCYAQSDKSWVNDPAGLRWETFFTYGDATTYGEDDDAVAEGQSSGCCTAAEAAPRASCCAA